MSARQRRLLPLLALLTIYVVWGSTYLAIRIVVRDVPPLASAFLRFFSAGLVMAGLAAWVDRAHGWPSRRQLADYALVGILLLAGGNALVMWAEQQIPSGITALIVATVPLWLTLLDGLRPGGEPWTLRVWAGTLLGFAGVSLVARPAGELESGHWLGVLALLAASVTWSVGSLYAQWIPRRAPLFTAAAIEMLVASGVLLVESLLAGEDLSRYAAAPASAWLGILYLSVFGSLIGFTAFAYCLNELPASTVGTYAYVNPVVAVALGYVVLAEPLSAGLLSGATLILLGVLLTTTARPRRRQQPEPLVEEPSASS